MAMPAIPRDVLAFVEGVLKQLGVPITTVAVEGFATWLANEQGSDWSAFENNKGNPLGIQTPAAQAAGKAGNMAQGIKLTAQLLKTPTYAGITESLHRAASVEDIATAIIKSDWSGVGPGNVYGTKGLQNFLAAPTGGGGGGSGGVNIPATPNVPPMPGVNIKNFHGYDLTAFRGSSELGKAEQVIEKYLVDPGYKAQVDAKLRDEYGYTSDWWRKLPEVNAVMIYAALELDPSSAASKNHFLGLLRNTQWWQQTDANQRAWAQAYGANGAPGSDPAQAQQALGNAQEKVLAVANQIGVTLTKQQLDQIAYLYASNNYVQSGSFGASSGTAQEWLDQAIVDTILNVSGQKVGRLPTDILGGSPGTSDFAAQTGYLTGTNAPITGTGQPTNNQTPGSGQNPTGLFGIAAQLYDQFQSLAQQYLMYNPQNPNGGLMNQQTILNWVSQTLQNYTGSGSSFGSSNLIQGGIDQFTNYLKNAASQYYPGLAESINQGILPSNYAAQYTNLIASSLGMNPAQIDYTSPKWNWVLNTPDPKTGVKTPLSLDQVQQKLVTLPQWQTANSTMQMGEGIITALNKQFGFGGT